MHSKVLITIDTEVSRPEPQDPFNHDVLGRTSSNPRGAYWISEQLRAHGLRGIFFLDVYGRGRYPEPPYKQLCDRLLADGHDIELHTHPDQMYDPKRCSMHEYSLAEQTTIIRDGAELLRSWTGRLPIAHRAGRYGANEATIQALKANGIRLDSSFYFGRQNCKLSLAQSNAPMCVDGVWEIPVTVAREPIVRKGLRFPFWTRRFWWRFQKLDVNTMRPWQLCSAVKELYGKVPYIVTFLHSFSFRRKTEAGFEPDHRAIQGFEALLRMLADEAYPVATSEHLASDLLKCDSAR